MLLSNYIIFGLIAVAIFTIYMAVVNLLRKDRNQQRAKQLKSGKAEEYNEYSELNVAAVAIKKILLFFKVDFNKQQENISALAKAGYNEHEHLIYFIFFKKVIQPIILVIGAVFLFKIAVYNQGKYKEHMSLFMSGILLVGLGVLGTRLFLTNAAQKRSKELIRSFPDALDLVLICVESGLGIDAARADVLSMVARGHVIDQAIVASVAGGADLDTVRSRCEDLGEQIGLGRDEAARAFIRWSKRSG